MQKNHIATLLEFIVTTYFSQLTSVLIVHNSTDASNLQLEYLNAVEWAFRNQSQHGNTIGMQWIDVGQMSDTITDFEAHILNAVDIPTEGFITILTNTVLFLHARYYATRQSSLRFKDKIYLFLCERENPHEFLSAELLQFYPNHLMVTPPRRFKGKLLEKLKINRNKIEDHNTFELWTQKFIGSNNNLNAILLDIFHANGSFEHNVELFADKLSDMKGRILKVGSITYIPYVVTNYVNNKTANTNDMHGNRTVFFVGSEANLIKTFCQLHNCQLHVKAYGEDNWGEIYKNGTSDGLLGDIYEQHIELAIGCMYNWYPNVTEYSTYIARSAVTILGPAPAQFPPWRTNILPFSESLWILIMFTICLCILALFLIKLLTYTKPKDFLYINALETCALDIIAIFMQQPSTSRCLKHFAARFFLAACLIATITLENIYSGQLKSILTVPFYSEPVDTVEKWSHTSWKWGAPSIVWVKTIQYSKLEKEQILTKNIVIRDYNYLYNHSFRPNFGIAIERLFSGSFSFGEYVTTEALDAKIVLKDNLYFDWTAAICIRGWPLMHVLNQHILTILETGLFIHWEKQMVSEYLNRKTQEILLDSIEGHKNKSPPQMLTIQNISGAILALMFGYICAITVFLLEIFLKPLLKYIHKI